jgi:hypothetical protein
LKAEEFRADREELFTHQYRDRVLNRVVTMLSTGDDNAFAMAMPYIRTIQRTWVAPERTSRLRARDQRVDELLRAGDLAALKTLCAGLSQVIGISRADYIG